MGKPKHRKGLWSPEEDQRLRNYVLKYGHGCWSSVPINAGLQRNGKSCRLRWINYLRPGLKRGIFTMKEEETILSLHHLLGNKWSQIAQHLPGRTDNEVKNYWHSYLKKRFQKTEGIGGVLRERGSITSSNMEHPQSPKKSIMPLPSFDPSSETMEKSSSVTSDQSIPQVYENISSKKSNKSRLPRLMFAEWLSLDSFACLGEGLVSNKCDRFDHFTSFQDNFVNDHFLFDLDATFGSGYQNSASDGLAAGDIFNSHFKFEGQGSASDHQFVNFSSGADICSDFNVNHKVNVLYI